MHALIALWTATAGGGGGSSGPAVTATPPGGIYTGNQSVVLTVSGTSVAKLRYKNGSTDTWHTVSALTTTISVAPTLGGKDVYCDALASDGTTVLASRHDQYFKDSAGGGG